MAAIEFHDVTKQYGDITAIDELELMVESGEIYVFLSSNSADKSTTINILLDLITPTAGTAEVVGYNAQEDPKVIRKRISVIPERYDIFDRLSGRMHIQFAIDSKGVNDDPDNCVSYWTTAHGSMTKR